MTLSTSSRMSVSEARYRTLERCRQIRCERILALPGNHDREARRLIEEFPWHFDEINFLMTEKVKVRGELRRISPSSFPAFRRPRHWPLRQCGPPSVASGSVGFERSQESQAFLQAETLSGWPARATSANSAEFDLERRTSPHWWSCSKSTLAQDPIPEQGPTRPRTEAGYLYPNTSKHIDVG